MRMPDYLRSVRHTFSSNRVRAALTLLGIMIGSGTIVLLAGFLRGGEEALLFSSQQANEADLIKVVRDDPPAKDKQRTQRPLGLGDAELLGDTRSLQGAPITTEASRESQGFYQGRKKRLRLVAAEPQALDLNHLTVEKGRFLDGDDLRQRRTVAVVGQEIWRELLEEAPSLDGISITVDGQPWSVVGVLKNKPLLGGGGDGTWMWNRKVLVPRTSFDAMVQGGHETQRVYVRLSLIGGAHEFGGRLKAAEQIIDSVVLERHLGVKNFKVMGEESFSNQQRLILGIIQTLLLLTGMLSLLVGGINIMNIMLVTVSERTREIGVRRALGASRGEILSQFLAETVFLTLLGAALGLVLAVGALGLATAAISQWLVPWSFHVSPWAVVTGVVFSVGVGLVFGTYPAWRASRLDPVEALRSE